MTISEQLGGGQEEPGGRFDFSRFYAGAPGLQEVNQMSPPDALIWYNRHGIVAEPAHPGEKRLARRKGYSFDKLGPLSDADLAGVYEAWQKNPDLRVAIICGVASDLVALDVDDMAQWEKFRAEYELPPTVTQSTGRPGGGLHLLFRRGEVDPAMLRQGAWSADYPGIEVKSKGLIIAAPSLHASGRRYQWLPGPGEPEEIGRAVLRQRAKGSEYDGAGRLVVPVHDRNPIDVATDVRAHLLKGNTPPRLFSIGADSAATLTDAGHIVPLTPDGWLVHVGHRVTFTGMTRNGPQIVAPPGAVMKMIPAVMIPELPPLDGVTTTPYLDADGSVVDGDGYHPGTRLVLHKGGLALPPVSDAPAAAEVAAAVHLLTTDWLGDFPFARPADKANVPAGPANVIACLLTLTGRPFFALAPLFVADASTPGSGKGLLTTTLTLIATGEPPHFLELPRDGEEQRKKITSALLDGQTLIAWDESHTIAGRTLAMVLTAEKYSDRLLGGNKMLTVTNRFTQVALGNNVQVFGDMKRRIVPFRMVPDVEHPEHRTGFRHEDLEQWVRQNRGQLLAAALTIWRNWVAKGRPEADVTMGSFERWAKAVGGALQAAGIEGFLSNTGEWLDDSDDDTAEWAEHLNALRTLYGTMRFTANDVADAYGRITLPSFKKDPDQPLGRQLGYQYGRWKERWLGDRRLVKAGMANGRTTWKVEQRAAHTYGTAENISTDVYISTENRDETDTSGRDVEAGRHETSRSILTQWPEGSAGASANGQGIDWAAEFRNADHRA